MKNKTTKIAAQQQAKQNLAFLRSIAKKTVRWNETESYPNISGGPVRQKDSTFTKYRIDPEDFKKVLDIIRTDFYLIMPQSGYLGFIGYDVLDLKAKLVLRFGVGNLPKDCYYTPKRIFSSLVRSKQNIEIYAELEKEKLFLPPLHESFENYQY